ncbi:hypothetical protein [Brevibacterium limosum]|uniref:hypothetical protein n=1 Tax=Brevibacterium limosum TaxID=2697565 RepID=UPI00142431A8|nr:hypothetical protein [Brevibacterium limosum]
MITIETQAGVSADTLREYAAHLERRFDRLEVKELRDPDIRRERQMDKYLDQIEAALCLADAIAEAEVSCPLQNLYESGE